MTFFILCGGDIDSSLENSKLYYDELISNTLKSQTKEILIIPFARQEDEWEETANKTKQLVSSYSNDTIAINIASLDKNTFNKQVQKASTIIIKGGNTAKLKDILSKLSFDELDITDKTISASSAGVYAISSQYYSLVDQKTVNGLGLVKISAIVHYKSINYNNVDWNSAVDNLGSNYPVTLIPEGSFMTIYSGRKP